MTESQSRKVKCPQCGRLALYSEENPYRPFCSERCRVLDLGAWADESYKIPDKNSSSDSLTSLDDDDYNEDDDKQ